MWNGLNIYRCFNSKIEAVTISNAKYDNSLGTDSYGICIESSTNTTIERVTALCAQECIDVTGQIPTINTYIRNCNLSSECRSVGFGMHESAYNTVVEDCTIGGISLYGPSIIKRCNIITNTRIATTGSIIIYGSHNKSLGKYIIKDCNFYTIDSGIFINAPSP